MDFRNIDIGNGWAQREYQNECYASKRRRQTAEECSIWAFDLNDAYRYDGTRWSAQTPRLICGSIRGRASNFPRGFAGRVR